jgi:hypothetical protein
MPGTTVAPTPVGGQGPSSPVSTADPFHAAYANPLAQGQTLSTTPSLLGGSSGPAPFGEPTLSLPAPTRSAGAPAAGQRAGGPAGFSTGNAPKSPPYVTTLDLYGQRSPAKAERLRAELSRMVARSRALPSRDRIQVVLEGEVIVLRGEVGRERERRLAEDLVRLTPGVRHVRNEIMVRAH